MTVPFTTEEKICKKNDVKARSLLLMALPNEHQLTLKYTVQKLVSRIGILVLILLLEDLNNKWILKWNMALLSMRGEKSSIRELGRKIIFDGSSTAGYDKSKVECFNVKEIGHFARRIAGTKIKLDDTAFKATTYKRGLSILEAQVVKYKESEVLFSEEIALLKRSVGHKDYLMGLVKTELEKVKEEKEGFEFKLAKFEKSSKDLDDLLASQVTDKSKRGFGYTTVPSPHPLILNRPTPLDLSYSGLEEFKQPEVNEYGSRVTSLKPTTVCDRESNNSKENTDDSLTQQPKTVTSSVVSPFKVDKVWKEKFFHPANHNRVEEPKKARENTDAPIIEDWVSDDEEEVESIPKVEKKIPNATKKESVKTVKPSKRTVRAVLMKTGLKTVKNAKPLSTVGSVNTVRPFSTVRFVNTVRPYNTAHPKPIVSCARPKTHFQNQAQRPFYKNTALTKRSNIQNINTGRQNVNTVRPNVNTIRARGFNAVKPSACWVWRPIKPNGASLIFNKYNYIDARGDQSNLQLNDKGFVDSGCSRHMSGNIAHLSDFKDFDGGYVTFGRGANGGRITGKGTIKTDKLDFEDVYFVKELKFNLFSVSQMCDKKNYVLFTDTEFAMATLRNSLLWHRRLGHVNFKNINKLVKENLVRDLPLKRFENDQTCVACLKGKQHRASCKTKAFSPNTKPLFMLHMDLFGPTFVSSLMHKKYCLVVTDDYSRFSWVFFLRTKDETSEILKNFIKEIENLVDKKVKIIRSDNGTKFKNHVMDEFCREKGIKREYSVARTPQQNGVAERKNMTLIEAARTMLADSKLPTTFWAEAVSTACYFDKLLGYTTLEQESYRKNLTVGFLSTILILLLEGNGPKWLFDLDSLTKSMNYVPVVAGTFSNVSVAHIHDQDGTHDDCSIQDNGIDDQQVNTASPEVNTGSRQVDTAMPEVNTATPEDLMGPTPTTEDTQVEDQEIDLGNISPSYEVPSTPHTRIHKDHPIDHVIGDVQSSVQTRRMTTSYSELGFLSAIYEGKTHQDFYTCLFACFLSQEEPKRVSKALNDPVWVEAMQEELLQFKLQNVWVLVDLPKGHRAIGTKWVYRNKKDERGESLLSGNKARLVQQRKKGIFISQDKYVHEILRKFNYTDVKSASTPTDLEKPLVKDADADDVDEHLYRSMIGSLMYLTASRLDIMFVVYACARFQVSPKTSHLLAVKRIFRYLKGKPSLGLWYSKDSPLELVALPLIVTLLEYT
ncbi:putative ribonuclease H-like domain-containing protein [Tanacetum coccineum]